MKKILMMTVFMALASAASGYAANDNMTYDKDTAVTASADTTSVAPATTAVHHKKRVRKASDGLATHSVTTNEAKTSRQGMPSGETNGPINDQTDSQNYGQPTNH